MSLLKRAAAAVLVIAAVACAAGRRPPNEPPPPAITPEPPAATPVPAILPTPVPERPTARIAGTVTYLQRSALTPEAEVYVELRDMTQPDEEAALVSRQVIRRPGQVPIAFSIEYDPSSIVPGRAYAVSARIMDRGQLLFVTETRVPVLTPDAPEAAEIRVVPLR